MDIFLQKDSTCFPYSLKLNHHNEVKGGKKVQNNSTTLLLEIQDVKVTGAEADHGGEKNCFKRSSSHLKKRTQKLTKGGKIQIATMLKKSDAIQVAYFYPYPFTKIAASFVHHQRKATILNISIKSKL